MMDYQKLKYAHELTAKSSLELCKSYTVVSNYKGGSYFSLSFGDVDSGYENCEFESIDELITKLEELVKPAPKASCCSVHAGGEEECKVECEHQTDGYGYYKEGIRATDFLLMCSSEQASHSKCKKCGEIYK